MDTEYTNQTALDIVMMKIGEISSLYAEAKTEEEIKNYKNKLDLLENFKNEIYKGNASIIKKIIRENEKGNI